MNKKYTFISDGAEKMTNHLISEFGDFSKFLNKEYKDKLNKFFSDSILNILNVIEEVKLDEYSIEELGFGGVDFEEFKQHHLPEFMRKNDYYDDYWGDVLSELTFIIIKIAKNINIL